MKQKGSKKERGGKGKKIMEGQIETPLRSDPFLLDREETNPLSQSQVRILPDDSVMPQESMQVVKGDPILDDRELEVLLNDFPLDEVIGSFDREESNQGRQDNTCAMEVNTEFSQPIQKRHFPHSTWGDQNSNTELSQPFAKRPFKHPMWGEQHTNTELSQPFIKGPFSHTTWCEQINMEGDSQFQLDYGQTETSWVTEEDPTMWQGQEVQNRKSQNKVKPAKQFQNPSPTKRLPTLANFGEQNSEIEELSSLELSLLAHVGDKQHNCMLNGIGRSPIGIPSCQFCLLQNKSLGTEQIVKLHMFYRSVREKLIKENFKDKWSDHLKSTLRGIRHITSDGETDQNQPQADDDPDFKFRKDLKEQFGKIATSMRGSAKRSNRISQNLSKEINRLKANSTECQETLRTVQNIMYYNLCKNSSSEQQQMQRDSTWAPNSAPSASNTYQQGRYRPQRKRVDKNLEPLFAVKGLPKV
jgi:hypothetical protein